MYAGRSRRKTTASPNISSGPIIQFWTSDSAQYPPVTEDFPEFVVVNLGQRRIHHQDEPGRYRDRGGADAHGVEGASEAGNRVSQRHSGRHRQKNPKRQIAIENRKSAQNRGCAAARRRLIYFGSQSLRLDIFISCGLRTDNQPKLGRPTTRFVTWRCPPAANGIMGRTAKPDYVRNFVRRPTSS